MASEKKIAVLDIGPSSTMLLLVSCNPNNDKLEIINEFGAFTKLGAGIEKTGIVSQEGIKNTLEVSKEVINIANEAGAEKIIMVASSFIRNIKNKTEFILSCQSNLNMIPTFLNENEEARLIYKGLYHYEKSDMPIVSFEIGGNYTNISFGASGRMIKSIVLHLGVLDYAKLSKSNHYTDMASSIRQYIDSNLSIFSKELFSWLEQRTPIFIWSGNLSSVFVKVKMRKNNIARQDVEGSSFTDLEIKKVLANVNSYPISERGKIIGLEEERRETFPMSMEILLSVLNHLKINRVTITTYGLRVGIIKSFLEKNNKLN